MVLFVVRRDSSVSAGEAWQRLTAWERHGRVVPLTRVSVVTVAPGGVGTVFVARSGVGGAAFDDPMEVVVWRPPEGEGSGGGFGLCRLVKRGAFVTGWAEVEVRPVVGGGSWVVWREELGVRGLPRVLDPVLRWAARWVFGRAVDKLLRWP
ncbi:SRPBCC family protein [Streptomyces albicerus]|uniref:SRPBCC family protein n=1 Tax=Streptomyces albicerus TaxID=2569859 RepID=UPI00124B6E74|nr:SRPBCC family protein [Streptomyces albicerus]